MACFNPRPRAGGDAPPQILATASWLFQSTPPRGGRPFRRMIGRISGPGFNPRPRAGGDDGRIGDVEDVSAVSIHAPARGATVFGSAKSRAWCEFQSTPPRGGRPDAGLSSHRLGLVSIHAPARGATSAASALPLGYAFQSTPPRGGRHQAPRQPCRHAPVSIHAPARGATGAPDRPGPWSNRFNPRPRAGGDGTLTISGNATDGVSIHAPARGATDLQMVVDTAAGLFQSTPPRGGRLRLVRAVADSDRVSIHAPARGATRAFGELIEKIRVSIHAPARGATPRSRQAPRQAAHVSIHAPARGATQKALFHFYFKTSGSAVILAALVRARRPGSQGWFSF